MNKIIMINYKSIFKYEDGKEAITYNEVGSLIEQNNHKIINFSSNEINVSIDISDNQIILKNNNSTLKLVKDKDILNDYYTEYGMVKLRTRLISFEEKDSIKIKYQLFDQSALISDIYILIRIKELEN